MSRAADIAGFDDDERLTDEWLRARWEEQDAEQRDFDDRERMEEYGSTQGGCTIFLDGARPAA